MSRAQLSAVPRRRFPGGEADELASFQDELLGSYVAFCECLNFAPNTVEAYLQYVRNALRDLGLDYVWQITAQEVRRYNLLLIERDLALGTRRSYCTAIKSLFAFLLEEHAADIEAKTGVSIQQPVTRRNTPRIRYCSSYEKAAPPTRSMVRKVSRRLREQLTQTRSFAVAARDLAIFETLYLTAMRAGETASLDVDDLYFHKGVSGQVHVRRGKGANGSGPRVRWIPMLDGLDDLLTWYLRAVRPKLGAARKERALFITDEGKRMSYADIDAALVRSLNAAAVRKRFTLHKLRHARASHLFEDGMDLVAIQKLLGHEFITTTQSYVHVDPSFVAKAHKGMVQRTLREARR